MTGTRLIRTCITLVLAASTAACGNGADEGIAVRDPWARASARMQDAGAVYFEISARGSDDTLLGARVAPSVAAAVEIHETVAGDGHMGDAMQMRPVDSISIEDGATISFEPGGYHIMLLDLAGPLEPGATFELVLVFEEAGEITITPVVRDP